MPLHFGKWLGTGAQKGHHLKQVTHQGNITFWRLTIRYLLVVSSATAKRIVYLGLASAENIGLLHPDSVH